MAGKTEDALKGPWLKLREEAAGLTLDELRGMPYSYFHQERHNVYARLANRIWQESVSQDIVCTFETVKGAVDKAVSEIPDEDPTYRTELICATLAILIANYIADDRTRSRQEGHGKPGAACRPMAPWT
jgi:hypothetical protein